MRPIKSSLRQELKKYITELAENRALLGVKDAEIGKLTDEKRVADEARKVADSNLEKLLAAEREVFNLKLELEKQVKLVREGQARSEFLDQQVTKLKTENDELQSVGLKVCEF